MFANDWKPVTKKYMKQYILNIILLIVGLIVCNQAWGQTTLPKTGSLSGNYTLTSNQTQTGTLTVDSGKSATINLNGQTLNGNKNIQILKNAVGKCCIITSSQKSLNEIAFAIFLEH